MFTWILEGAMRTFVDFYRIATGHRPPDYQVQAAREGLPGEVRAGADRPGIILAWLWRRLRDEHREAIPRRLVYALPQRGLAEPLAGEVRRWLAALGLTDEIALYVAGGAREESHGEWREDMHQPAIVIGTADVLVSRLLLRGLDLGMTMRPIDFALLANGAHWIADETRPDPQTTATLRQVVALAARWGTAEPLRLTSIAGPDPSRTLDLPTGLLASVAVRERHQTGTRTVVTLNTVEDAQDLYRDLRGGPAPCTLLHSRFRGIDRKRLLAEIDAGPADRIVVTTHAVEASLRLTAATVIGQTASHAESERPVRVIGESELLDLFDTDVAADVSVYVRDEDDLDAEVAWAAWTPGEEGAPDPEVRVPAAEFRCRVPLGLIPRLADGRAVWRFDGERYARITDAGQPPVRAGQVLLVSADDGGYDPETGLDPASRGPVAGSPRLRTPAEQEELNAAEAVLPDAETVPPEAEAATERQWQSLDEHSERVRDQAAALLAVLHPDLPPEAGRSAVVAGYLHDLGKAHPIWQDALCAHAAEEDTGMVAAGRPWAKSGGKGGRLEFAGGVSFRHELASLLLIDGPFRRLLAAAPDENLARYGVLAHHGIFRVRVRDRVDKDQADSPDCAGSLDCAGSPDRAGSAGHAIRGLVHGTTIAIPSALGRAASFLTVDLGQFGADGEGDGAGGGNGGAWTKSVHDLLARYGPFRLAYLETLVRMADWRASAGDGLPR
ncbi:MAG TPA: CRISPR-associated endonuclease Cas3'' [Trebonia sp.]|nr:CRISPR-associated endonuclease Cas3'' [Trebonia sp.]